MAFSDSRIFALGLGAETFKIRPRRAGFQPCGPVETFVFLRRCRRLQPRVGGPGEGPVWAPSGCPGDSSKFANSHVPPSNGPLRLNLLDRGGNTRKPVRNRPESICAGLQAPPQACLLRPVGGPIWVPNRRTSAGSLNVFGAVLSSGSDNRILDFSFDG